MEQKKFSWWYYKSIADEVNGRTLQYPLYEDGNTFKYDFVTLKEMIQKENPKILLFASPNNPTGNGLTLEELNELLAEVSASTKVLIDEAYASFVSTDTSYIRNLINKYPNLIISRTLSKFYGLPGLRMGFGFMSKELDKFSRYSNQQGLLYPRSNRRIYRNREDVGDIHQGIISGVRDNDYSGRVG